jgi:hypothetical protein
MQIDSLTEQAADKSLPHVVSDVVTTAVTDRGEGMCFIRNQPLLSSTENIQTPDDAGSEGQFVLSTIPRLESLLKLGSHAVTLSRQHSVFCSYVCARLALMPLN